jgi:hypothetical protein
MIVLAKSIARCFLFGGAAALAGCASYERLPLDKESRLVARASELEGVGGKRITLAALDRLVVVNNPDLRAARAKLGVGAAQVLQAGILPNPQVALSYPFFISGPGTVNAYSAGITQDVKSILLLRTKGEVAQNAASEISATLLWQEWQTIGKARLLFVDIVSGERAKKLIVQNRKFLQERFKLTSTAISQGNATLATLSPDLPAFEKPSKPPGRRSASCPPTVLTSIPSNRSSPSSKIRCAKWHAEPSTPYGTASEPLSTTSRQPNAAIISAMQDMVLPNRDTP